MDTNPIYITNASMIYIHLNIASHMRLVMTITSVVATIVFTMVTRQLSLSLSSVSWLSSCERVKVSCCLRIYSGEPMSTAV